VHYACAGPASVRRSIHDERTARGAGMSALMVAGVTPAAALIALAIYELQVRLERWDQHKHAED